MSINELLTLSSSILSFYLPLTSDELPLHVQAGVHCGLRHVAHLAHYGHSSVYSLQVRQDALASESKGQ